MRDKNLLTSSSFYNSYTDLGIRVIFICFSSLLFLNYKFRVVVAWRSDAFYCGQIKLGTNNILFCLSIIVCSSIGKQTILALHPILEIVQVYETLSFRLSTWRNPYFEQQKSALEMLPFFLFLQYRFLTLKLVLSHNWHKIDKIDMHH